MLSFSKILAFFGVALLALPDPVLGVCSSTQNATACQCEGDQASTKYPNKCEIGRVFSALAEGDFDTFLGRVAPDVNWTLMGTHPLAGEYHNRTIFALDALQRLANTLDTTQKPSLQLVHIVGGGDEEWSVQELHGLGVCKNGLKYDNRFSWSTRWNTEGTIVQVRAYLDSALVYKAITENESGDYTYTDQRNTLIEGPVGMNCNNSFWEIPPRL